MADAVDQGSLATDDLDEARAARDEFVAEERGLPDSASNDEPLPLEAIDTMVNKAEGDHEALAENAYQARIVDETDGVTFNGLTSVEEAQRDELREDILAESPDARLGADANDPTKTSESSDAPDATDAARTLAAERGIDLADVKGTGSNGRVTKDDVEAHASA